MGETKYQALTVHTRKKFKKKENFHHKKKENFHHKNKKDKKQKKTKRDPSNVQCYTCEMKRDTLQEIVPSGKGDTMLMLLKTMNQQKKYLEERRMILMKIMS